ncbi:hypothetical protein CPB84DRAFT_1735265 [Gymnopilus junonius]|uniref:C2H2-type domain-containing protein n=1 Tax=Gymnopilus junonius TaxID=109634 RepID=A0A9P5TIR6_GYMJU|nr:hypothetical protein CPB84DRAFT_1735265 [Gymnopilus junonius]
MPRAETVKHLSAQFYHSQFTNPQYLSDSSSSPPLSSASHQPPSSPTSTSSSSAATPKKKHVCPTCDRAFTTSGHLARHSRVHTGERNHKCPFPGCETRCSRQDNLQQHYRIHLSPGSRRSSTRSGAARGSKKSANPPPAHSESPSLPPPPPPPLSPPPLEQARAYAHTNSPPDSTPPLAQATLPATATLPITVSRMDAASDRASSSVSPQGYPPSNHNLVPISPQSVAMSGGQYSYRSGTTTYQEQSQGTGTAYTYVHTTPLPQQTTTTSHGGPYPTYPNSATNHSYNSHSMQQHHANQNRGSPVSVPVSSRHSISHISHPHPSYSQNQPSSSGPASPASSHSVSSHNSGPPTPTYPVFHDEAQAYHHHGGSMMAEHPGLHTTHINSQQPHILHNPYPTSVQASGGRFESPPPTLAPIQNDRWSRRDERHSSHHGLPYIHQPQPLSSTEYVYHSTLGLGHGAWKGDGSMRKGVGTALV